MNRILVFFPFSCNGLRRLTGGEEAKVTLGFIQPPSFAQRPIEQLQFQQWNLSRPNRLRIYELSTQYGNGGGKPVKFDNSACPVNCDYVNSLEEADVVFNNVGKSKIRRSRPSQLWVGTFWESVQHYPAMAQDYDYTMSYRADASFPNFGMIWDTARDLSLQTKRALVPYETKRSLFHDIAVLISNCAVDNSGRLTMVEQLSTHGLTIDSYGRCKHNKDESKDGQKLAMKLPDSQYDYIREWIHHDGQKQFVAVSGHLFTFAAENSICAYYHTEKVYRPLMAGSIPIYVGATTIHEYVPTHSIIMASDFKDLATLFSYIKDVRDDPAKYASYMAWRESPLPSHLQKKLDAEFSFGKSEWACNMCTTFHRGPPKDKVPHETVGCGKPATGLEFAEQNSVWGAYPNTAEDLQELLSTL